MWIASPSLGFFSVVLADDLDTGEPDPARLMIRARRREHLVLLQNRCTALADAEIIENAATDYRWRIVVEKDTFASVLAEIANGIDYRNVKSRAHDCESSVGSAFVSALHRIWSVLHGIQ